MKPESKKNVLNTIAEMYDEIFKAEQKVADYILANPERTITANVSELANFSGVSEATVIRLCKHLGFSGYYELKICLSRDIGSQTPSAKSEKQLLETSTGAYFQTIGGRIAQIGDSMDEEVFRGAVKLLVESKRIHVIALGNTSPVAMYAGYRLERLGLRCSMSLQPEYYVNHINLAQEGECVLAISRSGTTKTVIRTMEFAKEKGLKIVAVTGYRYSPMSYLADYLLLTFPDREDAAKDSLSRLNEMALLDVLLDAIEMDKAPDDSILKTPEMVLSSDKY
ncbi:MAG: MurR/RpiR family transcriptional regulator [Lachnospiraceae bacterium]|nr:MurR/RpiR family transcriptional regulator [Lachnospiraceae bacterium]